VQQSSSDPSPAADASRLSDIGAELASVETALRRLDDGSYGACEICGASLEATMLERDPLTTRCAEHPA
jgi:RNA polymerase-binding transcription factor DksA